MDFHRLPPDPAEEDLYDAPSNLDGDYRTDDSRPPDGDRMEEPPSDRPYGGDQYSEQAAGFDPEEERNQTVDRMFDIQDRPVDRSVIPDNSGEVDPRRNEYDERDMSSHQNFDPNSDNKKKQQNKRRSPQQLASGSGATSDMADTGQEGEPGGPPIPPHAQGVDDIFAQDGTHQSYGGPSREVHPAAEDPRVRRDSGGSRGRNDEQTQGRGRDRAPQRSHDPEAAMYMVDYSDTPVQRAVGNKRSRSRRTRRSRSRTGTGSRPQEPGKFDHTPHEVFVELHELDNEEMQWQEKARWIKFEENVEEATGQWGKPHVANLSFLQLIELRKYLESGSVLLDIEDTDVSSIYHRIVDSLVLSDQVNEGDRGEILRALFYDHWHVQESRGLVSGIMNYRRDRSYSRSVRRPTGTYQQRQPRGHPNLEESYNLSPQEQRDLRHIKHQNAGGVGVHFANGNTDSDVKIPIVQNERADPQFDEGPAESKGKKGKYKKGGKEPRRMTMENQSLKSDIMKKIPEGAEGVTVLVGEMDCLERPVLSFVRLAEGIPFDGLTEVPIPVRFMFVLLGPGGGEVDYYEIGRCFSTLMSSEAFNEAAYTAEKMKDILAAMNKFIGETMVLPAGNWNKELLMPVIRKQKQLRKEQGYDEDWDSEEDTDDEMLMDGKKSKKPAAVVNPLERVRRPFGGLYHDIKRRYPFYFSDFKDAINGQCVAAVVFIFFAALSPAITFGGLLGEKTENWMGISEMIVGSSVCGVVFALFSGQPLVIIGVTGPILVFEENLFKFCKSMDIEYLPFRFWTGAWLCLVAIICVAAEGSVLVRFISRFTEEIFSFLISIIFIYEVFNKLVQIYFQHPLHTMEEYCSIANSSAASSVVGQVTQAAATVGYGVTSNPFSTVPSGNGTLCAAKEPPKSDQPNTALLSTILMFGTYLLANQLKVFKNSHYLGKSARKLLADFGIPIAIMLMVGKDLAITTVYTTKLDVPNGLVPTDACKRGWFVNPMGTEKPFPIMWMGAAIVPALLAFILMFMEVLITELILNKKDNKLKKGGGFHLDLFILGLLACFNGLFGLPWVWSATVRSVTHLGALTVFSTTHAPGEKPRLEAVREQRVTALLVNLMIGLSIALAPVLKRVPLAVLFGVFLFMGVSSLNGVQFADRVFMMAMPRKHHPDVKYVREVRPWRTNMYTIIQLGGVAMLWGVKISPAALAFPFFLIVLVPIRKLLEKIFTKQELAALDCADAGEDEPEMAQEVVVPT